MAPIRTADVVDKAPKLLAQSNKNLILVLDGLCSRVVLASDGHKTAISGRGGGRLTIKEGDQLIASALGA